MEDQSQSFYYVMDHADLTVRAAQETLRGALKYSTPDRFIAGPMTAETLGMLFPKHRLGRVGGRNAR